MDVACHLNVLVPDLAAPRLGRALGALAELGYSSVVLPPLDPATAPLGELAARFRDHGLAPITLAGQAPDADVSSADPAVRERGAAALRDVVAATTALGGTQMNGVSYGVFGRAPTASTRAAFERAAAALGEVADHAHELGVAVTFEVLNRYESALLNTAEQARDFVALSGSPHLKVHLDTFHMAVEEPDLEAAVTATVPVLGYLELGQSGRGSLRAGSVDVVAVVRRAPAAGYRGPVGVEAFSRSVLPDAVGDLLAVWREPYEDGRLIAAEAIALIRAAQADAG